MRRSANNIVPINCCHQQPSMWVRLIAYGFYCPNVKTIKSPSSIRSSEHISSVAHDMYHNTTSRTDDEVFQMIFPIKLQHPSKHLFFAFLLASKHVLINGKPTNQHMSSDKEMLSSDKHYQRLQQTNRKISTASSIKKLI